jgi:hypothetical protein
MSFTGCPWLQMISEMSGKGTLGRIEAILTRLSKRIYTTEISKIKRLGYPPTMRDIFYSSNKNN